MYNYSVVFKSACSIRLLLEKCENRQCLYIDIQSCEKAFVPLQSSSAFAFLSHLNVSDPSDSLDSSKDQIFIVMNTPFIEDIFFF